MTQNYSVFQTSQLTQDDVKAYHRLDHFQDPKEVERLAAIYKEQLLIQKKLEMDPLPPETWHDYKNQKFLQDVFNELSDDSEDDYGRKIYREDRDPEMPKLIQKWNELELKFQEKRKKIIEENRERKKKGLKELKVPNENDFKADIEVIQVEQLFLVDDSYRSKIESREEIFYRIQEDNMQSVFKIGRNHDPSVDGPKPYIVNQLNVAPHNYSLTFDMRVEMAILAMRERRRYNQVRRLRLDIPMSYARIKKFTILPRPIQEELIKYPSSVIEDSDFEDDDIIRNKYQSDPVKYICQNSQYKREKLEAGGKPNRIWAAREKSGDIKYTDIATEILIQAIDQGLSDNGVKRGITKEKLDGTYQRPAHLTKEYLANMRDEYLVEYIKKFYDIYGDQMFIQQPKTRDRLLEMLKGKRVMLRKYPEIILAMYRNEPENIPEDLQVEQNIHKSIVIEQYEGHLSKRQSLYENQDQSAGIYQQIIGENSEIEIKQEQQNVPEVIQEQQNKVSVSAFQSDSYDSEVERQKKWERLRKIENKSMITEVIYNPTQEQIDEYTKALEAQLQKFREQQQREEQEEKLEKSMRPEPYPYIKMNKEQENIGIVVDKIFRNSSSGGSSDASIRFDRKFQKKESKSIYDPTHIERRFDGQQVLLESQYWYSLQNYIVNRCNDLGINQLKQIIPEKDFRKLSRREQTNQLQWDELGSSAEESDNSYKQAEFNHPLLRAKQRMMNQELVPIKLTRKERKHREMINIDGQMIRWGDFLQRVMEENMKNTKSGQQIKDRQFVMYQDDPEREKLLKWNYYQGFDSENSEDEGVAYRRTLKKYLKQIANKHGDKVYLRQRDILPFERAMLKFGGTEIIKQATGKKFATNDINIVYEWVDPNSQLFEERPNFLIQSTLKKCHEVYEDEKLMQEKVIALNGRIEWRNQLFANEFLSLYELFVLTTQDKELKFPQEIEQALPKSKREYMENINFQLFGTPPASPRKLSSISDESIKQEEDLHINDNQSFEQEKINTPDNEYQADAGQNFEDYQDQQVSDYEQYDKKEKLSEEKQYSKQRQFQKVEPQVVQIEQPKFVFPDNQGPDYKELQKNLFSFKESKLVNDDREIQHLIQEQKSIDPKSIENVLIPKLEQLVLESNGRLEGIFIWPHYRAGGQDMIYPDGRRYPKRLKLYNPKPEDKVIYLAGIDVGYLISGVPYLHPQTWKGPGIPLTAKKNSQYAQLLSQNLERVKGDQAARTQSQPKQLQRQTAPNRQNQGRQNNKKRKAGEALNLGAGMGDAHKDDAMFQIEKVLPFMRFKHDEKNSEYHPFEILSIDKNYNDDKSYRINLALKPDLFLEVKQQLKQVDLINVNKVKNQLMVRYRAPFQPKDRETSIYVNDSLKLGPRSNWSLINEGDRSMEISFIFLKQ
ncbi:UNKNOWN [Stylonychia lemnae]|uniref:Uncharacterized protein n=1 Tax=Stylonychia lemnae TaxID=5949 RepID=A0A078AUL7_STYLE|nr:UNKNOWN [Stylonychia lemnae]|eukprot:CDW84922.1 UNKNOWN [Stylonychia lemnae]